MNCECGSRLYALDTRPVPNTNDTRRRYECPDCKRRVSTIERDVDSIRNDAEVLKAEIARAVSEAVADAIAKVQVVHHRMASNIPNNP